MYIPVLSTTKDNKVVDKNRKDASIEQWEAELRESLAKKKAAASRTLTKDEKAAVDAQSKVEAAVRSRVQTLQDRLIRALRTIGALVDARTGELDGYLVNLNTLMEQLLRVPQANILAGKEIKWAFWKLADCCSPRLGIFGKFVGVAMLRTVDDDMVDEDFRHEPMHGKFAVVSITFLRDEKLKLFSYVAF